jgi:hypothetical protein
MTVNRTNQPNSCLSNSCLSVTPADTSGLSVSRNARLVSSMGPLLPGDKVTRIPPPLLSENSWVDWQKVKGTDFPRPTIGAPEHGFVLETYFPADTVKKRPTTAVLTLAPGSLASGTQVSGKTDCVLRHDLDMNASQIVIVDQGRGTRRGMSHRKDKRDTAYAFVARKEMAMRVDLPQGGHEFHLTLDPTQTGKKSMRGVTMSRDGQSVCAEEGINHVYYKFKDGIVTEWDSDDDESTIK